MIDITNRMAPKYPSQMRNRPDRKGKIQSEKVHTSPPQNSTTVALGLTGRSPGGLSGSLSRNVGQESLIWISGEWEQPPP